LLRYQSVTTPETGYLPFVRIRQPFIIYSGGGMNGWIKNFRFCREMAVERINFALEIKLIMATSIRLIRRYVWLVDVIRRAGRITLEELNSRWLDNTTLNPDHDDEIPERTFHRHREAIAELFGIEILCDRSSGNAYYIRNEDVLDTPGFSSWLFNGLAIDNQLISNRNLVKRIKFEDAPGGNEFLPMIIEAMAHSKVLNITYQSYNKSESTRWQLESCGLKQYRRRWYLLARKFGESGMITFALDRIVEAGVSDMDYQLGNSDELDSLFADVVGVNTSDDDDVDDIVVRVYGKQRYYFEGTPLHHSQQLIERTKEYSDYHFRLRPEYEFRHEILRLGQDAEILSPEWLREEMRWHAEEMLKRYDR